MPALQGHAESGVGQHFADHAFTFYEIFFGQSRFRLP